MKTKSFTKVTLLSIFVMSAITAVTLNSCQKERLAPKATDSLTKSKGVSDLEGTSTVALNEAQNFVFSMRKNQKSLLPPNTDSSGCTVITYDTTGAKPYSTTYSYGSNCIGSDGIIRSGSVVVSYDASDIRVVNNVMTTTYNNYSVNGTVYNGSVTLTNTGVDGNGYQVITETGTFSEQTQFQIQPNTINVNYAYEWVAGESSSPAANWQFNITGSVNDFQHDSIVIVTPLSKNSKNTSGCSYYTAGTKYYVQGTTLGPKYTFTDYGTPGGCSGQKSVTQNGVTTVENQ